MVSDTDARSRAQMILLGALTLAAIIIGLTVVVNSHFVTQNGAVSEVSPQIDEAQEFEYESRKGSRSLVLRLNHRHRNLTGEQLGIVIDRNMSVYSGLMAESYASSRGEYVNVTYNNESSHFGSRVVQTADGNVTSDGGQGEWTIGEGGEYRNLGWFTMNVDVERTSTQPTWINVTNATGHSVNVSINRTTAGTGVNLGVASNVSHAGNASVLCDPSRDRVLLDLFQGSAFTDDCDFNGTRSIEPPYRIDVSGGKGVVAKYELVYNETLTSTYYQPCSQSGPAPDQPCRSPAVWTANVTTEFGGSQLSYANEYNITVYREAR
ncbi:hypothetical protein [Halosimplex amylolyticum]|uniref:hypothetical protein n=1 Tax=Halosimplex amylolyticum TaxID=3396616 RepID=UPI003F55FB4B